MRILRDMLRVLFERMGVRGQKCIASSDAVKCTYNYSDAQSALLSPMRESLEPLASNDSLVSAPRRKLIRNGIVHSI